MKGLKMNVFLSSNLLAFGVEVSYLKASGFEHWQLVGW